VDGRDGVLVEADVSAGSGTIVLTSGAGDVRMQAGSMLEAGRVEIRAADDVGLGRVQADTVVLHSDGGTIFDSDGDAGVNVVAQAVSFSGYGPRADTGGNAIEVQAPVLQVTAPSGVALQDTGADGRTPFYVLDGGRLYEQAVGVGAVQRVTQDPTQAAPQWLDVALPSGAYGGQWEPLASGTGLAAANGGVSAYLAAITLDGAGGLSGAPYALGTPGRQPLSTGQAASQEVIFDYWLEDLVV